MAADEEENGGGRGCGTGVGTRGAMEETNSKLKREGDGGTVDDALAAGAALPQVPTALVLPHPSGVSHYWNSPQNIANASAAFQRAIKEADPHCSRGHC